MPSPFRAALPLALRFLTPRDVVRLVVAAFETREVALALWLLFGDAYMLRLDERQCLHVAAAEACWTAVATLLPSVTQHDDTTQDHRVRPSTATSFDLAVAVHQSMPYVFPASVMHRAVVRADMQQIQWLHTTTDYATMDAAQLAAQAKELPTVQWLLDHVRENHEQPECWLRLDDAPVDVRAVGWTYEADDRVEFCSVSDAHGFTDRSARLWDANKLDPELPLAEPFAAAGDRQALEVLWQLQQQRQYERHDHRDKRLLSRDTIVQAACGGHLGVVQWLYSLALPPWPLADAMVEAAANGHLAVVQWLFQFPETRVPNAMSCALIGGHLEVARWLRKQKAGLLDLSDYLLLSAAARSRDLLVFRFVCEELGRTLEPTSALFMGIAGDRPLIEYVVEHVFPADHDGETLVFNAAQKGTLASLQYLVEERNQWSRRAFRAAIVRRNDGCAFAQWIYAAATRRAQRLNVPLTTQLDFSDINILEVARNGGLETALWLVQHVPHVSTYALLGADAFHPDRLPHTCVDVFMGDAIAANQSAAAIDALLVACLTNRPTLCLAIEWLPMWAVRANCHEGFDRLVHLEHPRLFTTETRDGILSFSRNVYFMNTLLAHDEARLFSPSVIQWATKYGLRDQLHTPQTTTTH